MKKKDQAEDLSTGTGHASLKKPQSWVKSEKGTGGALHWTTPKQTPPILLQYSNWVAEVPQYSSVTTAGSFVWCLMRYHLNDQGKSKIGSNVISTLPYFQTPPSCSGFQDRAHLRWHQEQLGTKKCHVSVFLQFWTVKHQPTTKSISSQSWNSWDTDTKQNCRKVQAKEEKEEKNHTVRAGTKSVLCWGLPCLWFFQALSILWWKILKEHVHLHVILEEKKNSLVLFATVQL